MKKLEQFQGLRGVGFLIIFIYHCGITKIGGALGVSIFIILSGFLMVYNYWNKDMCAYSIKDNLHFSFAKIGKLYPLHLVMTFVSIPMLFICMTGTSCFERIFRMLVKFIINILLIQAWFPMEEFRYSMNNLSWFLSSCMLFYFTFPYILRVLKAYKRRTKAIYMCLFTYGIMAIIGTVIEGICSANGINYQILKGLTYNFPLYRLGEFFIGCNIGYLYLNGEKKNSGIWQEIFTCVVILLSCVIGTIYCEDTYSVWWRNTILYTLGNVLLIYSLAVNKEGIFKWINNKVLVYLGDMSPYLFLIHEIPIRYINRFIIHFGGKKLNEWVMVIIFFPFSLIMAMMWKRYIVKREKRY